MEFIKYLGYVPSDSIRNRNREWAQDVLCKGIKGANSNCVQQKRMKCLSHLTEAYLPEGLLLMKVYFVLIRGALIYWTTGTI